MFATDQKRGERRVYENKSSEGDMFCFNNFGVGWLSCNGWLESVEKAQLPD